MQQIVRKGGEREKARQIRRPRRVDRAMSVCTLAAQFLRPSAHGLTCEQIVKAFLLTLLCCHFCFGSGVSPSGAKKTFATFPGKRQFHSSRSQAPSARSGKGGPTTSSFQLSPQRNSRTTNPSPPPLFTVGDFPSSSSPALHFAPPASRFSYRISKIIVAST